MNIKLIDLLAGLDQIAPTHLAESWDNVGLLIGDPQRDVRSLLLGLDPTLSLLEEAISLGADTLLTHHPCIFNPLHSVQVATPSGVFLEQALCHKINVIACHTNFDSTVAGVSDALGIPLGLNTLEPLRPVDSANTQGIGRIGTYKEALSFDVFMQRVFETLKSPAVQIAGKPPQKIRSVALCGGSGSDLAEEAFRRGADIYLSSEIKHSTARWAEEAGFCIIDASHYATEKPAMAFLANLLETQSRDNDWDIEILQSTSEKPAFTLINNNKFCIE